MFNFVKGLFSRGKNQEDIIKILKSSIKEYVKAEKKDEGVLNLIFGILIFFLIIILTTTNIGTKIINKYISGANIPTLNHTEIFLMFILLIVFFIYCMHKVCEIQQIREENEKNS